MFESTWKQSQTMKSLPYSRFRILPWNVHTHTPTQDPPPTHTKKKNQQPGCLPILSQSTKKANSDVTRHLVGLQHAIEPRQQFLRAVVRVHQDLEASGAPGVVAWKFIRFNTSKWVLKVN